eukprot:CAMPEP_0181324500 /NCGR_PEP_ID=MMETSP1101-20121128/20395_1 /TAXON_ID=46948 /ORGANISM="Rhodomonas abbreviata, Strain Caron Lab Isolate" /LENGTH=212 /DNA_ID=CAMNT_0023432685 /DNA_START=46 /DNA_END=684 /DNA_ORIENTATION=-
MNRSLRLIPKTFGATRLMSTKAVSHEPPKKIHGTTGRYAGAVYKAASKAGILDKVEGELGAVSELIVKSSDFSGFLGNPTISRADKSEKIGHLITEPKFSHITRNLFLTLAANGRIGEADKIISAYEELMAAARGAVKVTIISAEALGKKQLGAVEAGVVAMVGKGKPVDVTTEVDPSILGGLQVMVGDRFLDLSVSSRVASISAALDSAQA